MTKRITKVRKYTGQSSKKNNWVVSILDKICGYVRPDGTAGCIYEYPCKADAIVAEALYLTKQGLEPQAETSAEKKDTNPKDALGIKKAPLHCIPCGPLFELGLAMMEGGRKYGTHNYRAVGVRASVYYDAIMRHLTQWWEGEDIDLDSGLHPLIKAAASIVVMRDGMLMNNYIDDRPIKYPNKFNMSEFNKKAGDIIDKYPKCAEPFLQKDEE